MFEEKNTRCDPAPSSTARDLVRALTVIPLTLYTLLIIADTLFNAFMK